MHAWAGRVWCKQAQRVRGCLAQKTTAKQNKKAAAAAKKAATAASKQAAAQANLQLGANIVSVITDSAHVRKLKVDELRSVLIFKSVQIPKTAKKPALLSLAQQHLKLPSSDPPPPMPSLDFSSGGDVGASAEAAASSCEAIEGDFEDSSEE